MVGQKHLLQTIDTLIKNNTFPRFAILSGVKGSGKKLISNDIAHKLCDTVINIGIKVDDIREMIKSAYKLTTPCVYVISDADNMSLAAKNALLKVTEEPPNNAYFVMTLEDANQALDTIRSRATVFYVDNYTQNEIFEYYWTVGNMPNDAERVKELCETPGEVDKCIAMCSGTVQSFYDYVELVVDNIATVSGANSFKIADKINLKSDDTKYDFNLFLKAFRNICLERASDLMQTCSHNGVIQMNTYLKWVRITSKYLRELHINGINKASTFDCWLLDIREVAFNGPPGS